VPSSGSTARAARRQRALALGASKAGVGTVRCGGGDNSVAPRQRIAANQGLAGKGIRLKHAKRSVAAEMPKEMEKKATLPGELADGAPPQEDAHAAVAADVELVSPPSAARLQQNLFANAHQRGACDRSGIGGVAWRSVCISDRAQLATPTLPFNSETLCRSGAAGTGSCRRGARGCKGHRCTAA
jgi:hypothetical protein